MFHGSCSRPDLWLCPKEVPHHTMIARKRLNSTTSVAPTKTLKLYECARRKKMSRLRRLALPQNENKGEIISEMKGNVLMKMPTPRQKSHS